MSILIIYCHPYEGSFNHAVLKVVQNNLDKHCQKYNTIDLYADRFDPVYDKQELSLYHQGKIVDPLVVKYLRALQKANTVIFITPIWWNSIPGMLKGYIDKVMKEGAGLSHTVTPFGIKGLLNIDHCYILTTSTSPTFYLRLVCGDAIKTVFIKTLKQLGFKHCKWINFGRITNSTIVGRQKHLEKLAKFNFL